MSVFLLKKIRVLELLRSRTTSNLLPTKPLAAHCLQKVLSLNLKSKYKNSRIQGSDFDI